LRFDKVTDSLKVGTFFETQYSSVHHAYSRNSSHVFSATLNNFNVM